jgi:hypothetical protein
MRVRQDQGSPASAAVVCRVCVRVCVCVCVCVYVWDGMELLPVRLIRATT